MMVRIFPAVLAVAAALTMASCGGSSNASMNEEPESDVSDLFAEHVDDERETVMISRADESAAYQISPASFDTVIVRAMAGKGSEPRIVDALLKGAFPDGCTELHDIVQKPTQNGLSVNLTMRRPESAMCTQVVRPYRFFFRLERKFEPGQFVLSVNGRTFPFEVE
jgi:hypothetical protein